MAGNGGNERLGKSLINLGKYAYQIVFISTYLRIIIRVSGVRVPEAPPNKSASDKSLLGNPRHTGTDSVQYRNGREDFCQPRFSITANGVTHALAIWSLPYSSGSSLKLNGPTET